MILWETKRITLDPGLTALALRARQDPAWHSVNVRAWERAVRWRRRAWTGGLVLAGTVALVGLALYVLGS